jgi:hypothetical protein
MRILYVFPHADDESFGPARAMAAQCRQGHDVYLLTLTRGEATKVRLKFGWTLEQMGQALDCYVTFAEVIARTKVHEVFDRDVHFELFREDQKPPFEDLCEGLKSG